jgi:hypothetical protein
MGAFHKVLVTNNSTVNLTNINGYRPALCSGLQLVWRLRGCPRGGRRFYFFLLGQLRPLLRPPNKKLAVPFIVGPSSVPFTLAGMLYAFCNGG